MVQRKFEELLELPIGVDFKRSAPKGFKSAWSGIKESAEKPFGRFNSAAAMRIKGAKLVQKNLTRLLRDNSITPDMADFVGKLPIDRAFRVNEMLCFALAKHIKGKGENAFLSQEEFNNALAEHSLPLMPEPISK